GFMGKFFIFIAAYQSGARWLLAIAIVGVVISIYYYFGWIRHAYFNKWSTPSEVDKPRPARTPVGMLAGVTLAALALASIVIGFYQAPLAQLLVTR
ncbi:MAG TPA: NADH-quinone oxidoreductase subunit N, partial [Opitutaceae bacterium]